MLKILNRSSWLMVFFAILCNYVTGDEINLKSGKNIEADIIERTDDFIKIEVEGVQLKYYLEDIEDINGEQIESRFVPDRTSEVLSIETKSRPIFDKPRTGKRQTSGKLEGVYSAYKKAIMEKDLMALKEVNSEEKIKGLEEMAEQLGGMDKAISTLELFFLKKVDFYHELIGEESATLVGIGESTFASQVGITITFKKEKNRWKIDLVEIDSSKK